MLSCLFWALVTALGTGTLLRARLPGSLPIGHCQFRDLLCPLIISLTSLQLARDWVYLVPLWSPEPARSLAQSRCFWYRISLWPIPDLLWEAGSPRQLIWGPALELSALSDSCQPKDKPVPTVFLVTISQAAACPQDRLQMSPLHIWCSMLCPGPLVCPRLESTKLRRFPRRRL